MDLFETPRLYAYTGGKAFDPDAADHRISAWRRT